MRKSKKPIIETPTLVTCRVLFFLHVTIGVWKSYCLLGVVPVMKILLNKKMQGRPASPCLNKCGPLQKVSRWGGASVPRS